MNSSNLSHCSATSSSLSHCKPMHTGGLCYLPFNAQKHYQAHLSNIRRVVTGSIASQLSRLQAREMLRVMIGP